MCESEPGYSWLGNAELPEWRIHANPLPYSDSSYLTQEFRSPNYTEARLGICPVPERPISDRHLSSPWETHEVIPAYRIDTTRGSDCKPFSRGTCQDNVLLFPRPYGIGISVCDSSSWIVGGAPGLRENPWNRSDALASGWTISGGLPKGFSSIRRMQAIQRPTVIRIWSILNTVVRTSSYAVHEQPGGDWVPHLP